MNVGPIPYEPLPPGAAAPRRPSPWAATVLFMWRTWQHTRNNPFGLAMDALLTPVLMMLIFAYLFGGAIAGSANAYLQYLLPGILVLTVVPMTVYSGTTLCQDLSRGVYNRFRTMPFWQPAAVLGPLATDALRYAAALLATCGAGLLLGYRPDGGAPGTLLGALFILLFAFSVSWIFSTIGLIAKRPETVSGTSMMVLYPLLFASNILVDSSTMPGWIDMVVKLNPISVAVTAARGLMEGTAGAADLAAGIGVCLLLLVVFVPTAFYLYLTKKAR
ncbi:transport permease protein [Cohnella xylanilytica]|uniref:ABC transporter permease n=1 Tax=Cohnella xylanilytica TaxID=557555 RepID=UPI001AFF06FC|nr:ABC transporter permease [Cohnella xylanilytica]GIO14068.1 transport permease protein [Cohnella xylanilytica]